MADNYKYYAVKKGRQTDIFDSWQEASEQVNGYSGAKHKGFDSLIDALDYLHSSEEYEEYTKKKLEDDFRRFENLQNFEVLKSEIISNFDNFTQKGEIFPPSQLLSESALSENVLKKIGVSNIGELEYIAGAFKVPIVVDLRNYQEGFSDNQGQVRLNKKYNNFYASGINNSSIEEPKGWKKKYFLNNSGEYLYHRGHMIAKSFQKYTRNNKILSFLNRKDNIFISTNWMNHSNHKISDYGVNQTYIENCILKIIEDNPKVSVNYRTRLIFDDNERIPRGIHIMAEFDGKILGFKRRDEFSTLNIFIPNIDPRFIMDYLGKEDTE